MKIKQSTKAISAASIQRKWHMVDVSGKTLGRITNEIASLLQGKRKVSYSPNLDAGDFVIVINASNVTISGRKTDEKIYSFFSGYPSGLRKINFKALLERNPKEVIRHAVAGMLPKNKLRDRRLARMFVFKDDKHPYGEKLKS